mmetsp:Transcript_67848/g.198525  ORF Transcript_67848/g.198525 Transcript_67848/m.198525 type:complete len:214 (+) Transcript_67848:494-1135(+)
MLRAHALRHRPLVESRQSKVRELYVRHHELVGDRVQQHQVQTLQITVDDGRVEVVKVVGSSCGVHQDLESLRIPGERDVPAVVEELEKGAAAAVLKCQSQWQGCRNQPYEVQDVGMVDPGKDAQFSLDSLHHAPVNVILQGSYFLHRHRLAAQPAQVHRGRGAFSDLTKQFKVFFFDLPAARPIIVLLLLLLLPHGQALPALLPRRSNPAWRA